MSIVPQRVMLGKYFDGYVVSTLSISLILSTEA